MPNCQLANELHRHIIRKYKGRKDYSSIKDNIWGVDIADIESLSKYNRRIKYLLLAIDLFSKYEWVVSWKDKNGITIANTFQKFLDSSNRKANKI